MSLAVRNGMQSLSLGGFRCWGRRSALKESTPDAGRGYVAEGADEACGVPHSSVPAINVGLVRDVYGKTHLVCKVTPSASVCLLN